MKKTLKIFALILSLMMLLSSIVGAVGINPEKSLDWFYYQHYILGTVNGYKVGGGSWFADYFTFKPSSGVDGFGLTSPFGVLRNDERVTTFMPVFEFHSLDRTKGDFNTKNLTALEPTTDGSKYLFQNGESGFTIFNVGDDMYAHPGATTSPVLSFTAPYDGEYMWQLNVQREYMGYQAGSGSDPASRHDGKGTGTIFRVYRENELIERAYVNRSSYHDITVTARLSKGQTLYLEMDPWNNDTTLDGVFIRYNKVTVEKFYDGVADKEYDNTNETPLYSVGFLSDIHTEFDIVNQEVPVVQAVQNAVEFLKNRGKVDVMLVGGDTISETWVNTQNANQYSKWTVDNMDDVIAGIDEILGKATKNGENVLHVSGNHDSHVSLILNNYNKNTAGYEYLNSSDYYKYMLAGMGDADAKLCADDLGYGKSQFNDVLCYRYELNGMHFIGINQPYSEFFGTVDNPTTKHRTDDHFYFPAQIEWVADQLEVIPKDETVIILGHYNLADFVLPSTYKTYNSDAYKDESGKYLDPMRMFIDTLENYPNVMYLYGHIHGGDDKTYVWYNTKEHIQIQGAEEQLADGSYATNGWLYMYSGIINNPTQSFFEDGFHKGVEDSPIAQVKVIDFYNDHITINTYNVGDDTAVIGVETLTSYTIKREMTQLNNYSGNGSGNVEAPVEDPTAAGQIYVPTSISDSNNGVYRFNLGINNVENENFVLRGMHRLTGEAVAINDTAVVPSWDGSGTYYTHYDALGHGMFVVSQYNGGAFFDMTPNNKFIAPVVAFKANATAAYSFDADFIKLWSPKNDPNAEGSYVTIDVMRSDGTLIKTVSPDGTKWNQQIDVSGSVYLREGEELWFVVRQADTCTSSGNYETALTYLNVVQHTSWEIDLEEIENNENNNANVGGSTGGGNNNKNPQTGAVSIAVAAALMGSALTAAVMMVSRRRRKNNV